MPAYLSHAKIFLYAQPTDLRKGFEGLSFLAETHFHEKVTSGAFFVFLNKKRNMMKILFWDQDGLAIWHKRLEQGLFGKIGSQKQLSRREFLMLPEGE